MSGNKLGRREFITSAAKTFGAVGIGSVIAESFMGHVLNTAFGASPGGGFYIHLSLPGGPPRWYFDQPLNPSGSAADFTAGSFGNMITQTATGLATTVHSTYRFDSGAGVYHIPPVWNMARSGNNNADLLRHMQMFRGVDMQINNHLISNQRQVAPVIGGTSIGGSLSDASALAMASVFVGGAGASTAFRSEKALASIGARVSNGALNPLSELLKPFRPQQASGMSDPQWQQAIGNSLQEFESYLGGIGARPNVMKDAYEQAIELINSDKFKLTEKWPAVYAKYKAAVDEALSSASINKFFPKPIKADGTKPFRVDVTGTADVNLNGADLRTIFNASTIYPHMADVFALTEIVVTEKLSSNITVPLFAPQGFKLGTRTFNITHDQHFIGTVVSTLSKTVYYRAVINCLHELVDALKASGQFNDTVIHIGSEFSRTARADGAGSDHGFAGSSASIISGKINNFNVIGNVHKSGGSTTYPGTWGRAADFQGGRAIWVQDIANTICAMLAIKPVSENGIVLLNASGGWKPIKKEAKNVA